MLEFMFFYQPVSSFKIKFIFLLTLDIRFNLTWHRYYTILSGCRLMKMDFGIGTESLIDIMSPLRRHSVWKTDKELLKSFQFLSQIVMNIMLNERLILFVVYKIKAKQTCRNAYLVYIYTFLT